MKSSSLLAVAPLLSFTYATIQLDIIGKRGYTTRRELVGRDNGKDADETSLSQDGAYTRYYVNVTIGEPGQNIQIQADTGSSDVWVIAKDAEVNPPAFESVKGTPGGTFDIKASSTASDPWVNGLNISYLDGSGAFGDLFTDSLTVAGTKLDSYTIGVAKKASSGRGYLGLGFSNGLSFGKNPDIAVERKKNLVDAMVDANQITSQAFSLWLNDIDSSSGALLFGGIDAKKFDGNLANIAMYPTPGMTEIDHPTVSFTSFTISTPSGNLTVTPNDYAYPAVLDSGATQTFLPDAIVNAIYAQTGATYFAPFSVAAVPCSARSISGTFDFGFAGPNGPIIKVPIGDLIYPGIFGGQPMNLPNTTQQACVFGISPASARGLPEGASVVMGDTLLRSAYVVYDLANKRVGLAQTRYNSTESEIVQFASQGAEIPRATSVKDERRFTVTEMKPLAQYTQPPPNFSGPVGSAFAAAFTGELAYVTAKKTTGTTPAPTTPPTGTNAKPSATTSRSAAGAGPKPIAWDQLTVLGLTVSLFAAGGLFFI